MQRLPVWICICLVMTGLAGCTAPAQPPKVAPAAEKPRAEADLARTSISKKAYISLGIKTNPPRVAETNEQLALTGWIMARPGSEVTLTAPAAGYVSITAERGLPIAGSAVEPGDTLLCIEPVLSPVEQIQVAALKRGIEGELKKAQSSLKNAESEYLRLADLFKQNLRSKQEYEQAQKARDHAAEELAAANDKLQLFLPQRIAVQSPQGGMVLQTLVGNGQYVPTAAPLLTVIDLNPTWVRVPVPEHDLTRVDLKAPIEITLKNAAGGEANAKSRFTAKPTGRLPFVDPLRHTAELLFEIDGNQRNNVLVKDLMVAARVPLDKKNESTLVPYSAIIFDAHGQTWIYVENSGEKDERHSFERKRVEIVSSQGKDVIIQPMLARSERGVTAGGAILFSREFFKTPVKVDGEEQ